ncbi:hypothetical protein RhiXN_07020 [Rhizoctonia solani]|uniref:Tf2-1-like SH3-like domain-containing protein n=1 Tax=Rhizoctonia solani TaxID=456999 RepID=A0A8H8P740_9AGAM|nr:uncharacterized protein RhiXN_07020 [Rhizoctonia solani]QRW25071.1 hypothetical protein RhiXN_07020 [Rhizoctonia solani]
MYQQMSQKLMTWQPKWKHNGKREAALQQSKSCMTAGETREPISFEVGEEAWLDAKNVKLKTLSPKLTEQRLGPFEIMEKISDRAYRLKLPPSMRIHNVFYVGLLSKVKRDDKRPLRPTPTGNHGQGRGIQGRRNHRHGRKEQEMVFQGQMERIWIGGEYLGQGKTSRMPKNPENFEKAMKRKALGAAKALRGGAVL